VVGATSNEEFLVTVNTGLGRIATVKMAEDRDCRRGCAREWSSAVVDPQNDG